MLTPPTLERCFHHMQCKDKKKFRVTLHEEGYFNQSHLTTRWQNLISKRDLFFENLIGFDNQKKGLEQHEACLSVPINATR